MPRVHGPVPLICSATINYVTLINHSRAPLCILTVTYFCFLRDLVPAQLPPHLQEFTIGTSAPLCKHSHLLQAQLLSFSSQIFFNLRYNLVFYIDLCSTQSMSLKSLLKYYIEKFFPLNLPKANVLGCILRRVKIPYLAW